MQTYFESLVKDTLKLVSIDSVQAAPTPSAPFGEGVNKCIDEFLSIANSFGFKTHNESGYYGTAVIGEGEEFGILGHMDVVPFNKEEWSYSPYGEIQNNVLYGRGVLDDKGPTLACLYAVKQLIDEGFVPSKKIKFIVGGNEETGWKCIERYNELETMPFTGISPDADFPVINCEKGICHVKLYLPIPKDLIDIKGGERPNMVIAKCSAKVAGKLPPSNDKNITISQKDNCTFIQAVGIAAHGSTPEKGDNAFLHILKYLSENLKEYVLLYNALKGCDGSGLKLNVSDKKSGALSCNIGVVAIKNNNLEITLDIRYPISINESFIVNNISKVFNCKVEIIHSQAPLFVDKDDPLVVKLLSAYEKVTGENVSPITIGGGTYARALKHGVGFGPVFPNEDSSAHEANEHLDLKLFEKAYNIYLEAIKNLCF